MSCKNEDWREKLINEIRCAGISIAENAENIANKYTYMCDDLEVIATFNDRGMPCIEVRQRFLPENYVMEMKNKYIRV